MPSRGRRRQRTCRSASTPDPPISPRDFRAFLDAKREASADVEQAVRAIIADVAARGDAALVELTQKFDRVDLGAIGLRVTAGRDRRRDGGLRRAARSMR